MERITLKELMIKALAEYLERKEVTYGNLSRMPYLPQKAGD